jgi:hypothetical protein
MVLPGELAAQKPPTEIATSDIPVWSHPPSIADPLFSTSPALISYNTTRKEENTVRYPTVQKQQLLDKIDRRENQIKMLGAGSVQAVTLQLWEEIAELRAYLQDLDHMQHTPDKTRYCTKPRKPDA